MQKIVFGCVFSVRVECEEFLLCAIFSIHCGVAYSLLSVPSNYGSILSTLSLKSHSLPYTAFSLPKLSFLTGFLR